MREIINLDAAELDVTFHIQHGTGPVCDHLHHQVIETATDTHDCFITGTTQHGWWRSTVVERRSLTGEVSLSCTRPAADG